VGSRDGGAIVVDGEGSQLFAFVLFGAFLYFLFESLDVFLFGFEEAPELAGCLLLFVEAVCDLGELQA
jgi:hypothetical protein